MINICSYIYKSIKVENSKHKVKELISLSPIRCNYIEVVKTILLNN